MRTGAESAGDGGGGESRPNRTLPTGCAAFVYWPEFISLAQIIRGRYFFTPLPPSPPLTSRPSLPTPPLPHFPGRPTLSGKRLIL